MGECHSMSPSTVLPEYKGAAAAQSHTICKQTTRHKIKIIHIIAPEIIKTDVSNFRELVQRLTGKPDAAAASGATVDVALLPPPPQTVDEEQKAATIKKRPAPAAESGGDFFTVAQQENTRRKKKIKCEVKVEERGSGDGRRDDDHCELWMGLNPGGFLSFLEEDVFQGMMTAPDFFQLPLDSSRMDLVGEI